MLLLHELTVRRDAIEAVRLRPEMEASSRWAKAAIPSGHGRVTVTAIHNKMQDTIRVSGPSGEIEVPPGETRQGSFIVTYDPDEHGTVSSPNGC